MGTAKRSTKKTSNKVCPLITCVRSSDPEDSKRILELIFHTGYRDILKRDIRNLQHDLDTSFGTVADVSIDDDAENDDPTDLPDIIYIYCELPEQLASSIHVFCCGWIQSLRTNR